MLIYKITSLTWLGFPMCEVLSCSSSWFPRTPLGRCFWNVHLGISQRRFWARCESYHCFLWREAGGNSCLHVEIIKALATVGERQVWLPSDTGWEINLQWIIVNRKDFIPAWDLIRSAFLKVPHMSVEQQWELGVLNSCVSEIIGALDS